MLSLSSILSANPTATAEQLRELHNAQPTEWGKAPLDVLQDYLVRQSLQATFRAVAAGGEGIPPELAAGAADLIESLASPRLVYLDLTDPVLRFRWTGGIDALHGFGQLTDEQHAWLSSLGRTDVTPVTVEEARLAILNRARKLADDALAVAYDADPTQSPASLAVVYTDAFVASMEAHA